MEITIANIDHVCESCKFFYVFQKILLNVITQFHFNFARKGYIGRSPEDLQGK